MGVFKTFLLGPMCAINRIISEPPSHRDCAIWSAKNCPFLSRPRMVRTEKDMPPGMIEVPQACRSTRNPGAVAVWTTKTYHPFQPPSGSTPAMLFSARQAPTEVMWFANGRRATRKEVLDSIDSGYPTLEEMAREEGPAALAALATQREVAMALVPD